MPKKSTDKPIRHPKLPVAGAPLRTIFARPRTTNGKLTYAGAERHEHKALMVEWERAGK